MNREQGFVLPIVVFVLVICVFLCFFLISQLVRHHQFGLLYAKVMEAQYAAESGIALMQQRLKKSPQQIEDLYFYQNDCLVTAKVTESEPFIVIEAVSMGRYGVKQTVRAKVDPKTLAIAEWSNGKR